MNKKITVGDILRLVEDETNKNVDDGLFPVRSERTANVAITRTVNDTQHYITTRTTEQATLESLVEFYGWAKLDKWEVVKIRTEHDGENSFIHLICEG